MWVKYWINSSKAVVGVDQPMKTLSMHIKAKIGTIFLSSHCCHFVKIYFNQTPSCISSIYLHCVDKVLD